RQGPRPLLAARAVPGHASPSRSLQGRRGRGAPARRGWRSPRQLARHPGLWRGLRARSALHGAAREVELRLAGGRVLIAYRLNRAAATLAYSFGLPSPTPDAWRAAVTRARAALGPKQLLVVSVVGTPAPDGDGEQLAADYAACARWAAEAGADVVEVHLSAP